MKKAAALPHAQRNLVQGILDLPQMSPQDSHQILCLGDQARALLLQVIRDQGLPDTPRANALRLLPTLQIGRPGGRELVAAIVPLTSSGRRRLREAAVWAALQIVELAEQGRLPNVRISRQEVNEMIDRAKQIGLRKGTRKRLRRYTKAD